MTTFKGSSSSLNSEKLPPHDTDAEEATLGSLLIDGEAIHKISTSLNGEDFFDPRTRLVYEACQGLYKRNEVINQITVAQELNRLDRLEPAGGPAYLAHLISIVPTSLHVEYYSQIVQRLSTMRRLIDAAGKIAALGYQAGPDVDEALNKSEDILFKLRHGQSQRDFVHISQVLDDFLEKPEPDEKDKGKIVSPKSYFTKLDEWLGGLQRSDLVILAARPSVGKTSFALSIARNAAVVQGCRVAIFSLEMSRDSLVHRFLASEADVDIKNLRLGLMNDREEKKVFDAMGHLAEAEIYFDDTPQLKVVEMRSKALRLHYEKPIDLIIVDYLQLIGGNSRGENRVQEISEITRSLKGVARELNVPVLVVSQLSRAVEFRSSHIPQLADLRESGSIEQDADVVLFIYREELYFDKDEWLKQHPDKEENEYPKGIAEVHIAKHRNGPTGQINLRFIPRTAKFVNLEG